MSVSGMLRIKGVRCRVRRAVVTAGTANAAARTWADAPTPYTQLLLEEISAQTAQRIWGLESVATVRGTADPTAELTVLDGIVVTTGKFKGQRYQVVEDPKGSMLGPQFVTVGLVSTKETFGL